MGGIGSTRWGWHTKRLTVESCFFLQVKPGGQVLGTAPVGTWRIDQVRLAGSLFLMLRDEQDGCRVRDQIEVSIWTPRFGGHSLFLLCPKCRKKFRKLFSPPRTASYRCRRCWNLAYESSQDAHRWDRGSLAAMMAPDLAAVGISMRQMEKFMRAEYKAQREAARQV